ncbi:MAG: Glu-tRNA(Gln) amidotransferase subunit GatE [Desulfurococcales archaeon]|nr:Glu-tRNA(Gln) amidotransferase subunit GatE [Desulfurococcales archaeon]
MAEKLDYRELGLKVGLELHQQLATTHKLFCGCPAELALEDEAEDRFIRKLRPTRSELGEIDPAALFEWKKGRKYIYDAPINHSCLVEADEEPPHPLNREALLVTLGFALSLGSKPVNEVYTMRKIVIDGSNTSGFQRTALVALGGSIEVEGKNIGIQTVVLEEDASRKLGEKDLVTNYKLDRLGIPLIEVATAPDIQSPEEARNVAYHLGLLFRLTGKVRRGIGTIRQDINVSINGGAITEIKGVQTLELIPKAVEMEALRQYRLLKLKALLEERHLVYSNAITEIHDLTRVFTGTKSKIVSRTLKKGGKVLGIALRGMKGIPGFELTPGRRFGTELADYARFWSGVGGLFHSDELPAYGITEQEVEKVYTVLGLDKEQDAFILVADEEEKAAKALKAVVDRIKQAFKGVPEETRQCLPDGTTRFLRPRPGSARMYPETDIPPTPITIHLLKEAERFKPPHPSVLVKQLSDNYGINRQLALQLVRSPYLDIYTLLAEKYRGKLTGTWIASVFTNIIPMLRGEGVPVDQIPESALKEIIDMVAKGEVGKEAVEEVLRKIAEKPDRHPREIVEELGLTGLSEDDVRKIVIETIEENMNAVKERGERSFGLVMGKVMAKVRGRFDGKKIAEIVREELSKYSPRGI